MQRDQPEQQVILGQRDQPEQQVKLVQRDQPEQQEKIGATGPTGATGANGGSAIIPFASGSPVTLVTTILNLANTGAAIGFGNNFSGVSVVGANINLGVGTLLDFAFVVPDNGTITSVGAFFSTTAGLSLLTTITVQAQLYVSAANSSTFTPLGSAISLSPALGPVIAVGANCSALQAVSLPVTAGQKLLMIFRINPSGISIAETFLGFASAGIKIV